MPAMNESARDAVDLDRLSDLRTPWCVHVVVTLRIAEHIAAGATAIGDLAAAARCDVEALRAVLDHLAGKGVFRQPSPGVFVLNDAARALLDPARRIGLDLEGIGGRMAHAWGTLLAYVRTGEPAYHERFGLPFWEDLDAHPDVAASFDALIGIVGHGTPEPQFELTDGWTSIRTVVDVGGGTGLMLAGMLRLRPTLRGTLVDLPRTVARSADVFRVAGVADRVVTAGQSFFDPLPSGADLYLLKSVLNDWPDRDAIRLLARCAEAARPAGRVVVLSGVVPDDASKGGLEIEMVLAGGRRRTASEFRELARAAGLDVVAAGRYAPSKYFVVECRPAS
jgi:2,7-dihydroxy-5-methyl-1-naphthoate 7-O-methyltransferase